MFIHLHSHSYYSFLDGLPSPAELAHAAANSGMGAMALTDAHSLTGAIEFYDACRAIGIRPILGLEANVGPPTGIPAFSISEAGSLIFLATDLTGWRSLCRLSSALLTDPAIETSRVLPFEILAQNTDGLICLTGGKRGAAARLMHAGGRQPSARRSATFYLERLREIFPDRLFIELQKQHADDGEWIIRLASLAQHLGLPVVATQDIHYLDAGQAGLHRLLTSIRVNRTLQNIEGNQSPTSGLNFTTPQEMLLRFAGLPESTREEAIANTLQIAERCQLELPLGIPHHPEIQLPSGQTPIQVLRQKAESGAFRLYGQITPPVQDRLDHELAVIGECGYASLFLIMEEIIQYAHQHGVPVSSRGSAASSLVAHCLGITSPDPLRLNLYFERFLNPVRATPPDIDTDLCSRRRDDVIRFVYQQFGADRVAMICTINRFRKRSALREVAKAHGLSGEEIKTLADSLPHRWWRPAAQNANPHTPYADLEERYSSPLHQKIFQDAAAVIGLPRHLSVHAGGVVIAPGPLTDLVPTMLATKGMVITQFDLDSIERLGLVKIDLLGIRGLTVLGDVAEAITKEVTPLHRNRLEVLEAISEQDPHTADLVRNGQTIGCFQIESPGMRATLKEIQAGSVDDILVALALYRPGPLTGGLKDAFVRRYRGQEQVTHLHPALTPLLSDTYGVILYQEQVLRIAHELAGLSLADADLLRRAMSHFDPGKQMQTLKEKFIAGSYQRSRVPEAAAERIWELMAAFAGYGFPKAHAASYAQVAWRIAWCKVHYPAIMMAAVLANWGGYYPQRVYLNEARRLGLVLRPPHINYAQSEFSVRFLEGKPVLFMGLNQVRELTRRTQARILRKRPFHSFTEFLANVDPRPIEAENLVRAGALDGIGNIPSLLRQLGHGGWRGGQLPLFAITGKEEDWTIEEKMAAQEAVLGVGIAAHPLEFLTGEKIEAGTLTTIDAASQVGQRVRLAGMRQTWRRSLTVDGGAVYFMSLEDLEGMLDVVLSAKIYQRYRRELSGPGPYMVEGVVELNHATGEPFILAERVSRLK